jgi:pyruvate/2-oxoglutarate dehydrogenase complex dihydrolipoamide acyltransferase (E2) component
MPVTLEQIHAVLDPEEVNYQAARELGPEALPQLAVLARGPDMMLATKAIYLASLIQGAQAEQIVEEAALHPQPAMRVAAATGLKNLKTEDTAGRIAERLVTDQDLGVRKVTVKSVASLPMPALRQKIRAAAEKDPDHTLRDLVIKTLPE